MANPFAQSPLLGVNSLDMRYRHRGRRRAGYQQRRHRQGCYEQGSLNQSQHNAAGSIANASNAPNPNMETISSLNV